MIPENFIHEWQENAPWQEPYMIEQDLIICKALVCIFSDEFLASQLAFRGGTALHKLHLQPQPRYSEDIDLVQINPGPIKPILFKLGEVLDWLPNRVTKPKRYNNTMIFRMESEVPPIRKMRLKVEINCMEHFNVLGLDKVLFDVQNSWFTGGCKLTTYKLDELIGTKLRALYQRKKGRDLLDLQLAIQSGKLNVENVLRCYDQYMKFVVEKAPSYKQFVKNIELKLQDPEFLCDTDDLIREDSAKFDPHSAWELVKYMFVDKMH